MCKHSERSTELRTTKYVVGYNLIENSIVELDISFPTLLPCWLAVGLSVSKSIKHKVACCRGSRDKDSVTLSDCYYTHTRKHTNFLLFMAIHLLSFSFVIYFNRTLSQLTLQWTFHIGTGCCWKNKGSMHLKGSLLFARKKQKQTAYPTVLPASVHPKHAHGMNSCRQWCSLVSTQCRHCRDERCVLMRAVWEFNEARTSEPEAMGAYWCEMFLGDSSFFAFMCWIPFYGFCNRVPAHVLQKVCYDLFAKELHSWRRCPRPWPDLLPW